jgi:hypothetical protein
MADYPTTFRHVIDLQTDEQSGTIMGIPLYTSEHLSRGEVLQGKLGGRGESVHMHPHTAHALLLSLQRGVPMSNIQVQLDASLWWVQQRIERQARAAEARLDAMVMAYERADNARAELRAVAWDEPHDWVDDLLRLVIECDGCHIRLTHETAVRVGVRW